MEFTYNPFPQVKGQGLDHGERLDLATDDIEDIHPDIRDRELSINLSPATDKQARYEN